MASMAPLQPILSDSSSLKPIITASPPRPPITCHVLDTKAGIPAADIPVTLTLVKPYGPSQPLNGRTNSDGRVTFWEGGASSLEELFASAAGKNKESEGDVAGKVGPMCMVWALKFDVGKYFKGEGFWEEVEIRFKTDVEEGEGKRDHWHVPLLLSPWSYTTYRGS